MNYYRVEAKCGHVGMSNYIIKNLYVHAETAKEAAFKIRRAPRVKHHHKDAIRSVVKITEDDYYSGVKEMNSDHYFNSHCIQDQRMHDCVLDNEIIREEERNIYKKHTHARRRMVEEALMKEDVTRLEFVYG